MAWHQVEYVCHAFPIYSGTWLAGISPTYNMLTVEPDAVADSDQIVGSPA